MTERMLRLVVVGESLVDIVHRADGVVEEAPGGSPANTALTLGRLGRRPTLITRLAQDDRGAPVRRWLEDSDVEVVAVASPRTWSITHSRSVSKRNGRWARGRNSTSLAGPSAPGRFAVATRR